MEYTINEKRRHDKVTKLKYKILKEASAALNECRNTILQEQMNTDKILNDITFERCATNCFALYKLNRAFCTMENLFMRETFRDDTKKIVGYAVSITQIDRWLQPDYNFIDDYLLIIEYCGCEAVELSDYFFGYRFDDLVSGYKGE